MGNDSVGGFSYCYASIIRFKTMYNKIKSYMMLDISRDMLVIIKTEATNNYITSRH